MGRLPLTLSMITELTKPREFFKAWGDRAVKSIVVKFYGIQICQTRK